jgi:methionyl-tRNA formyltransferase
MKKHKTRVAIFGSFYRGFYVLNEMLHGSISSLVEVVGVASDNPDERFTSPDKRVWQYPHKPCERVMVKNLAEKSGLEVFMGKVNDAPFHQLIEKQWRPDICLMATFGQRIRQHLIDVPTIGFYNLHPCYDDKWPSHYVGGNPFSALMRDKKTYSNIAFHAVDESFDTGPLIALSDKIFFPDEATVVDMHKITSFAAAQLASRELVKILREATADV